YLTSSRSCTVTRRLPEARRLRRRHDGVAPVWRANVVYRTFPRPAPAWRDTLVFSPFLSCARGQRATAPLQSHPSHLPRQVDFRGDTMRRRSDPSTRVLPDGTPLQNRLLAALPTLEYNRIAQHLRVQTSVTGDRLHERGRRMDDVYFPNGGVFSITTRMGDGSLVEVATVGREGMLGVGAFLGDRAG